MVFMTTAAGVVVVDAPPTIGHNILRAIATVTKSHVTHAVYSHHHADHTGAMVLYEGARFYAQSEVAGLLRQTRDPNRPLPHVTFDDQLTVQASEDRVELAYHGPNHSPGNIFTYLPAQRVLMLVNVVFPGWVPFAYLAESQNIPGWLEAPAQALRYPFHTFVGGHLTRLGGPRRTHMTGDLFDTRRKILIVALVIIVLFGSIEASVRSTIARPVNAHSEEGAAGPARGRAGAASARPGRGDHRRWFVL